MIPRHKTAVVALHGNDRARPAPRKTAPQAPASSVETVADLMGDDQIVSPRQAAQLIGVANATLQLWRSQGEGPRPFVVNGKTRGYTLRAIRTWIRDHEKA
jgi:hypothetical protein